MIKTIALLTRREGLSHEDFVKHWRDAHAPLVHAVPGRYVQSHIVEERTRPDIPTMDVEIDGIAELWYDDQAAMERQRLARCRGVARRRRPLYRPDQELRHRRESSHSAGANVSNPGIKSGASGNLQARLRRKASQGYVDREI